MRKIIGCLLVIAFMAGSCLKKEGGCGYKDSNVIAPSNEIAMVESYLSANSITGATKHASGMYYQVVNLGAGGTPHLCSQVQVAYVGKLTNGTIFDQSSSGVFTLGGLIEGWKKGIPLIQKGGSIKLYIPPTLGYGQVDVRDKTTNAIVVPANSVLVFEITLSEIH
jgi:FKBP-type peptidyl-prolyl cis-trans isomerase FkpA